MHEAFLERLRAIAGPSQVLTGSDAAGFGEDWYKRYRWSPLAVVRPASTGEVSEIISAAYAAGIPIVPISGNTGTSGGTEAEGALMISLARMNRIIEIRPNARTMLVEAGAIVEAIHNAAAEHSLIFPVSFGAQGTAQIGGALSTNAGGSNVLRYGNARNHCLGLEVVLPDGRVMDLMTELHKDNSGYDLRDLMIGAEGTLGLITKAVLKLSPMPQTYATAFLGLNDLDSALALLNELQAATGGAVDAFECMPANYLDMYRLHSPTGTLPLGRIHPFQVLVELASGAPRDTVQDDAGETALNAVFSEILARHLESGGVVDAVLAQNETQRRDLWRLREMAAELSIVLSPNIDNDIAIPTHCYGEFLRAADERIAQIDGGARVFWVSHLGDGNLHFAVYPSRDDETLKGSIKGAIDDIVTDMGGSFSAEHGVGKAKLSSMAARKNPVALDVMRAIKAALDPKGLMNPGKVVPPA
ncbi:MAG: FAD-binding oxidoreductase [Pseudomonadota bacterium]